ncbi:MAG: transglycosylase SLT domain-containing protein, partial [Halochromatium sp.]|uniref:lytic transglycosylase domain-containing protein n=1 Tax=Halochromatium sp. TaxID=2049430 RepID=UPI00397D715A
DGSTQRECWYRRALLATGRAAKRTTGRTTGGEAAGSAEREAEAFAGLAELYLTGRSLPAACDPLFAAWYAAGGLDSDLVWARVERALARDNAGVAAYQARYLPSAQQHWLERLVDVHRRPQQLLEAPLTAKQVPDTARRQYILVHGLQRLAERAPEQAELLRASIAAAERLPAALAERADAAVGQALVSLGDARGLDALARLEARDDNIDLQLARLRTALRARAWSRLAEWSRELPAAADELGEWRYWRGQALMRVATSAAERAAAAHAFASAAEERSLWGFLSAELVGRPLALDHRPIPVADAAVEALLASETIAPIQALQVLGRDAEVAREWRALTASMPREQRLAAAAAAARLGLVNESILTLARAAYWDDLELRFPLAHMQLVHAAAAEHGLPLDWVYAVIRQESAFAPGAASHAGAIGLMQLMPATAREVATKTGRSPPQRPDLTEPALNIALGTAYLAEMQRRFDGHPLIASAAYNAGPTTVRRWLPEAPMPGPLWMTEIPYAETRQYVRRVLTYRIIYRQRLGLAPLRVGALLRPVP